MAVPVIFVCIDLQMINLFDLNNVKVISVLQIIKSIRNLHEKSICGQ